MKTTPRGQSRRTKTRLGLYLLQNHVLLAANQEYETSAIALIIVWPGDHSKTKLALRVRDELNLPSLKRLKSVCENFFYGRRFAVYYLRRQKPVFEVIAEEAARSVTQPRFPDAPSRPERSFSLCLPTLVSFISGC
jgi:hypothetical protein